MTRSFCPKCGTIHAPDGSLHPSCLSCGFIVWENPVPVTVVLVPLPSVRGLGLLTVRRGIEPGKGKLALPGGFVDRDEPWVQAGIREVREETGLSVSNIVPFWISSTKPRPNRILLFGEADGIDVDYSLPPFKPNEEVSERGIIYGSEGLKDEFAFSLHYDVIHRWFEKQGTNGPSYYETA